MLDDVDLFLSLNREYESKPLVPEPATYDPKTLALRGRRKADSLNARYHIDRKRVLEVGCGYGETAAALATRHRCDLVAIDIDESKAERWSDHRGCGVDFRILDISTSDASSLGTFDFVYSNGMLEHVAHPFGMLRALAGLIRPRGRLHLNMGLHRGAIGSHLYRDVFFPWPHLVFTEATFAEFYRRTGREARLPVWINHLTVAQYLTMFDLLGLHPERVWYTIRQLDRDFYARFEDVLGRYPTFDLERDMMYVDLVLPAADGLCELGETLDNGRPRSLVQERLQAWRQTALALEAGLKHHATASRCLDELTTTLAILREAAEDLIYQHDKYLARQQASIDRFEAQLGEMANHQASLDCTCERLDKDLRGIRKLGRSINWTSTAIKSLFIRGS